MECLLGTEQEQPAQASSKKAAPHAKPAGAPIFKGVTWSSSNGQWRAQAWDGKKVGQLSISHQLGRRHACACCTLTLPFCNLDWPSLMSDANSVLSVM